MRELILKKPKDPTSLTLIDTDIPEPGPKQVRVKISSMGLNRGDLLYCQGRYFYQAPDNSRVGFEGAGFIDKLGSELTNSSFAVGDRVAILPMSFDVSTQGCFSEYAIYDIDSLIPSPSGLSDSESGAIWMAYLTAWGGMIECGRLAKGETVVVTAASSSVGLAAIQIAKMAGAFVIATSSHEAKASVMLEHGADAIFTIPSNLEGKALKDVCEQYVEYIRKQTDGKGSDLVFDAVAGPASYGLVKGSAQGGRIVIQGMLDRRPMDIHAGVVMKRRLSITGYTLDATLEDPTKKAQAIEAVSQGFNNKQLKPVIAKIHPLSCFANAFEQLQKNQHIGKIVLIPDS